MTSTRQTKWMVGTILTIVTVCLIVMVDLRRKEYSIDGTWRNDFYNSCLCDAYNFFVFKDGVIVEYSDRHFTNYAAGSYAYLGSGRYQVTLAHKELPPSIWVVRPGNTSWRHPSDEYAKWYEFPKRLFHRPQSEQRERNIIDGAAERDARFRATLEEKKANKTSLPTGNRPPNSTPTALP